MYFSKISQNSQETNTDSDVNQDNTTQTVKEPLKQADIEVLSPKPMKKSPLAPSNKSKLPFLAEIRCDPLPNNKPGPKILIQDKLPEVLLEYICSYLEMQSFFTVMKLSHHWLKLLCHHQNAYVLRHVCFSQAFLMHFNLVELSKCGQIDAAIYTHKNRNNKKSQRLILN